MDIPDYLLINRNLPNTQNGCEETLFRKTSERNEPSSSMYKNTLKTFIKDDTENVAFAPSKVNLTLAERQPRSQTRKSDPLRIYNCNDCLPPLETEQQFRIAVKKCARGGDSMERISPNAGTGVARVSNPSPLTFKTEPVIISSSPIMKAYSFVKEKRRKTAAEIDTFFSRLSTPKHIKEKASKDKKNGAHVQQASTTQRQSGEATKGLRVNVVRTRSNSAARSKT